MKTRRCRPGTRRCAADKKCYKKSTSNYRKTYRKCNTGKRKCRDIRCHKKKQMPL